MVATDKGILLEGRAMTIPQNYRLIHFERTLPFPWLKAKLLNLL